MGDEEKIINPHNPEFITKVPWYLGQGNEGKSLEHHSVQKNDHYLSISETEELLKKKNLFLKNNKNISYTFKKGACKNCGATTHKEKDCFERPRSAKNSAWKNKISIASDDVQFDLSNFGKISYDAKRDIWKGYDADLHQQELNRKHELLEKEQILQEKKKREEALEKLAKELESKKKESESETTERTDSNNINNNDDDDDDDDDWGSDAESDTENNSNSNLGYLADGTEKAQFQGTFTPQGGVGGHGMRITSRHLRLREDTPKYLRNLSLDSAFYDPKSRSMRSNPQPHLDPSQVSFAGDNFLRQSGDAVKLAEAQIMCWEMEKKGESSAIDLISTPSLAEITKKDYEIFKKNELNEKTKEIYEKYGIKKKKNELDQRLLLGQTEVYQEYDKDGQLLTENKKLLKKQSKYEEDVYPGNHTSIFGSYYNRLTSSWGYACCHSLLKNSYCTGEKGKEANDAANNIALKPQVSTSTSKSSSDNSNSSETTLNEKRKFSNPYEQSEEDQEEYLRKKSNSEDPMAKLLNSDTILEYK